MKEKALCGFIRNGCKLLVSDSVNVMEELDKYAGKDNIKGIDEQTKKETLSKLNEIKATADDLASFLTEMMENLE